MLGDRRLELAEARRGRSCRPAQQPVVDRQGPGEPSECGPDGQEMVEGQRDEGAGKSGGRGEIGSLHALLTKRTGAEKDHDEDQVVHGTRNGSLTVAPFRAWRGSRDCAAWSPAPVDGPDIIARPPRRPATHIGRSLPAIWQQGRGLLTLQI